jgi:stalled ribosome rescue protein Dom34
MTQKVGLWIDHRKAVVVSLGEGETTTRTIESNVGQRVRSQGGSRAATVYSHQGATYEPGRDQKYERHLNEYYDEVASAIAGADAILVMGPGEAKTEFGKRLERSGVDRSRVRIETSDKLTEPQIVEKIKVHFGYRTRESF